MIFKIDDVVNEKKGNIGSLTSFIRKREYLLKELTDRFNYVHSYTIPEMCRCVVYNDYSKRLCSCGSFLKWQDFANGWRATCGNKKCVFELRELLCLEKYGVSNPMQNKEVMAKYSSLHYKRKTYILPSKKEISIQGYEHFALDELLKTYTEDDIITGNENVPTIWYECNDTRHRHYVDIFIPNENLCIEVKSTWTLECKKDNVFIKQAAAKDLGYNYEIWVYDNKGNKIETFK